MPEMRAETEREARRKGIAGIEKATDPYELTSVSALTGAGEARPDGSRGRGRPTRAERLRTARPLRRGETGGPS